MSVPAPPRPKVGLLVPRFTAFDAALGPERVARLRARGDALAATLRTRADVVFPGTIEDDAAAAKARAVLAEAAVECVVIAPAMAAPPTLGLAGLPRSQVPVVLWNAIGTDRLSDEAESAEAIEHTTTVGCQMLGGALARVGRPAAIVSSAPGDDAAIARLLRTVVAAAAAGSLSGRTVVRIGAPPPGYVHVEARAAELARLGLRSITLDGPELAHAFEATTAHDAAAILDELAAQGLTPPPGPVAERSARLARAIELLLDRHAAVCGAVNCLGPLLAGSDVIGTVACLAVVRETGRGRPVACTADVPAAIALHLGRRLGGAALYGEWYTSEAASDAALFLGDGGADPAWAEPGRARLAETQLRGVHGPALGLATELREGPVTLLALGAAADGWRLAWGTGVLGPARSHRLRGPNGLFHPDGGDAVRAASRLIASGVTHHPVLVPGRLDEELPVLATALGAHAFRISG